MSNVCRHLFLTGFVACVALTFASAARAQGKGDSAKVTTVDGVELHASFYQSPKKAAPIVICLHPVGAGENSGSKNWKFLAESLQPNYSVLLFDFRGHGKSTTVQPELFWSNSHNLQHVKGGREKRDTIDYKDFSKSYYLTLANDLAAIKSFLDRRNDQQACNTSNTILIGAENAATIGAVWLNSEWNRFKLIVNPMTPFLPPQPALTPEGRDVVACIWLSPDPKIGSQNVTLTATLEVAAKGNATPMVFMYGDADTRGQTIAKTMEAKLKTAKHKFTAAVPVKGNTKLTGEKLLQAPLGTDKAIKDYLDAVIEAKGQEWGERDFRKTNYAWRLGTQLVQAKSPNDDTNLMFFHYEKFSR